VPACVLNGRETNGSVGIMASDGRGPSQRVDAILNGIKDFFSARNNCDESFVFACHGHTVAGVYIGAGLGKPTVASVLQAFADRFTTTMPNQTVVQICPSGGNGKPERVFGLSVDTSGNLAAIQKMAVGWSRGDCVAHFHEDQAPLAVKVFNIASAPFTADNSTWNGTANTNDTWPNLAPSPTRRTLSKRATCSHIPVESGDGCASLAAKCKIRGSDFMKFNPNDNLCATLNSGDFVCCCQIIHFTAMHQINQWW
jgi:hypothetical protein